MLAIILAVSTLVDSNVRSSDPVIAKVLADGMRQSPVIQRLVEVIDASDVIVYLSRGKCPSPAAACTMISSNSAGVRYVRINFKLEIGIGKRPRWHPDEMSVMLAHELQHAAEIAQWPEVVDNATLVAAYARLGVVLGDSRYETYAARRAGDERRAELQHRRR